MIQVQRKYFKEHTEYTVPKYDLQPIIVACGEKEMLADDDMATEFEGKVLRIFKRQIAEEMAKDIKFEICTVEVKKDK